MKPPLSFLLLLVLACPCVASVAITTTSLPSGTVSSAYSVAIAASGGCTPYSWAISSGALPAGITKKVSSTTKYLTLSGTPTIAASYSFAVSVTGCGHRVSTSSYNIAIRKSGAVTITTASIPNGTVNTAYSASINASGSCTPYSWAIASGTLPAGITSKASSATTSLVLSGTPSSAKSYPFTVSVKGCAGSAAQDSYTVVIQSGANHVVDLSWKASSSSNVAGYNLYRSPDAVNWKKENLNPVASTLYSDSTVSNGSTYYYAATAVDVTGKESSKSAPVKVTVP